MQELHTSTGNILTGALRHLEEQVHQRDTERFWHFVRAIKSAYPRGTGADEAFEEVEEEVERRGGWSALGFDEDPEELYIQFVTSLDTVHYRLDEDPLEEAYEFGCAFPAFPKRSRTRINGIYCVFLGMCAGLKMKNGGGPIMLPRERVAEVMDTYPMMITRLCRLAEQDGYLRLTKEHNHARGEAAWYEFDEFPDRDNHKR